MRDRQKSTQRTAAVLLLLVGWASASAEAGKVKPPPSGPPNPAIAYLEFATRNRVMVCNEDGSNAAALYAAPREKDLGWVRMAPRDAANPNAGSVIFTEGLRSAMWQDELKRVRFEVTNGVISVKGVDMIAPRDSTFVLWWPALSPDGQLAYFVRGGFPSGAPDRLRAVSLVTLEEEPVCEWPAWGSSWPEQPGCDVPPDWPDWVYESLFGVSPDGSRLLLYESNWGPDFAACPELTHEMRVVALDLAPTGWGNQLCEFTVLYGPTSETSLGLGEAGKLGHEIVFDGEVGGVGGLWRLDYDAAGATPTLVPGTDWTEFFPSWSCDDSKLVFTASGSRAKTIQVMELPNGEPRTIATPGMRPHWGRCVYP